MAILNNVLPQRQQNLKDDLDAIFDTANGSIESIRLSYDFLKTAIKKAKTEAKGFPLPHEAEDICDALESYEGHIPSGQIYTSSQLIPEEFGTISQTYLDESGEPQDILSGMSDDSRILFAFIYHQLFISLVAILEAYITDVELLIFKAYPQKIGDKKVEKVTKPKFTIGNDCLKVQISFFQNPSIKFKDLTGIEKAEAIDQRIQDLVRENLYGPTHKQINLLRKALSAEINRDFLMPDWADYSEMNARRNSGVHAGWRGVQEYNEKIRQIKNYFQSGNFPYFKSKNLSFDEAGEDFLGFDADYFCRSYRTGFQIIDSVKNELFAMLEQNTETE